MSDSPADSTAATLTDDILREVNQAHGFSFERARRLTGGAQSGAWLIHDGDRRRAVLKWSPERSWAPQIQRADRAVRRIRRCGYPTPAWLAVGVAVAGAGYGYQVQEYVEGMVVDRLDHERATRIVEVLEQQRDLDPAPDRCWSDHVSASITTNWTASLGQIARLSPAGETLALQIRDTLGRFEQTGLPRRDLVHGDFRLANVIFASDLSVAGVVDIEALGSGTRVFDYATLLDHVDAEPAAVEVIIRAAMEVAGPALLVTCFVHVAIDLAMFLHRRLDVGPAGEHHHLDQRMQQLSERLDQITAW